MTGCFSLSLLSSRFIHVGAGVQSSFLFRRNTILSYVYTTLFLFLGLLVHIWVASTFWLLQIMLQLSAVFTVLVGRYVYSWKETWSGQKNGIEAYGMKREGNWLPKVRDWLSSCRNLQTPSRVESTNPRIFSCLRLGGSCLTDLAASLCLWRLFVVTFERLKHLLQNYGTRDQLESLPEFVVVEFNFCDEIRQARMQ